MALELNSNFTLFERVEKSDVHTYHRRALCLTEYTSVLTVREDQEVKQQGVGFGRLQDEMQAINMAVIGGNFSCVP
jgi:hypothetical protein